MKPLPRRHTSQDRLRWRACACGLLTVTASMAHADQSTVTAPTGTPNQAVTTTARLDFVINIGKMMFLRVGTGGSFTGGVSGTGPAANATVDTVAFTATPSIPSVPTTPANGNGVSVRWTGGAPSFNASAAVTLPVEVRSNAGPVNIVGQATTPLTSGANTIPMTAVSISSSDPANLPAPVVPATGASPAVAVAVGGTGTAAAPTLLTYRTANWTFAYTPSAATPAGVYSGQITFTASSP